MNTQLKKGTIELAILKLLQHEDSYGYEIGKYIANEIDVKEGTIYLILQRLEKAELLDSYFKSENSSKKRKYYQLNTNGEQYLSELIAEWEKLSIFIKNCSLIRKEKNE